MRKLIQLLLEFPDILVSRDSVIDLFTVSTLMTESEALETKMVIPGKLYTNGNGTFVVVKGSPAEGILESREISITDDDRLDIYETFSLEKGMIANYSGPPVETTVGEFLLNYVVLVKPFGAVIPYINNTWDIGVIEGMIAEKVLERKIVPDQVNEYIDRIYAVSGYADFCVPAMSEKSITSNPAVTKRRNELFEEYADQLNDPNIMLKIENELVAMDKEALKDDTSAGFLISGKNYAVQRKRMFSAIGMVESFGDPESTFMFAKTDLNAGWKIDELDILANDVRRGSYNRAKTTAKGGAESKFLGRTFQESRIIEDDCGTKRGITLILTKDNAKHFIFQTVVEGTKLVTLTKENINSYIGKSVIIRSPMYCASREGYCYTCMDSRFKEAGIRLLNVMPIAIGSAMLLSVMKSMHGRAISALNLDNLNEFLV